MGRFTPNGVGRGSSVVARDTRGVKKPTKPRPASTTASKPGKK